MANKPDTPPHRAPSSENDEADSAQAKSPLVRIPREFGIWQITVSFHFPSAMSSVLCIEPLPKKILSELERPIQGAAHHYNDDQTALINRLAEAESRLRLTCVHNEHFGLQPICQNSSSIEQMSPSLRRHCSILHPAKPFDWLPRVSTSFSSRNVGSFEFFNDFVLHPNQANSEETLDALDTALLDVAAILADRRSHMFAQGLAQRTYNVFLPPAIIYEVAHPLNSYIVVSVLSFIRLPNRSSFRRTFSLSLLVIPVSKQETVRSFAPDELLYSRPEGDLGHFLDRQRISMKPSPHGAGPLRELVQDLLFAVVSSAVISNGEIRRAAHYDHIYDLVVRAVQVSVCGGYCSMMPDVSVSELRRWQVSPLTEKDTGRKLKQTIVRLLGRELNEQWAMAEPSEIRLLHGRGAEPSVPTFYFSFGLQRLLFTPSAPDLETQDTSILWVLGWHILLLSGISALLEMLGTFHHEMERRPTAVSAQAFLKEFLVDLEEYFDFELLPAYRLDFDALKSVEGVDTDFQRLRERVTALGQERIIEEGRRINQRLLWIGIGSFVVSVILLAKEFTPITLLQRGAKEPTVSDLRTQPQTNLRLGTVVVSSSPDNADISVDGAFLGTAPSTVKLPPGNHTIRVTLAGFKEWTRDISVLSGSEVKLLAPLEKQRRAIAVTGNTRTIAPPTSPPKQQNRPE